MPDGIRVFILGDDGRAVDNLRHVFENASAFVIKGSSSIVSTFEPGGADVVVAQTRNPHLLTSIRRANVPCVALLPAAHPGSAVAEAVLAFEADPKQIRAAATAVAAGLRVHSEPGNGQHDDEFTFLDPLTQRELEVLNLMAEGYSNPEIARRLDISRNTAKFHVSSVISKLGVGSRTAAVSMGLTRGLIIV